jgi:NADPH2:quinone reductase
LAGFEAAGEVVDVGEAVSDLRPGALVIGVGDGAFAEYVVLPAAAAMPLRAGWPAEQALGLAGTGPLR